MQAEPRVHQLTLPDAARWEPERPTDPDCAAVLRLLEANARIGAVLHRPADPTRDRQMRRAVEQLRRLGWPVISSSGRKGYVLSFAPEDLADLEKDLRARALSTLRTLNRVKRIRERRLAA